MKRSLLTSLVCIGSLVFLFQNCSETKFSARSKPVASTSQSSIGDTVLETPKDQTIFVTGQADFRVVMSGSSVFQYEWFHNGQPLSNERESEVNIMNARYEDGGAYTVDVYADGIRIESFTAYLTVIGCPNGQTASNGVCSAQQQASQPQAAAAPAPAAPRACALPWGGSIGHGGAVTAYAASSPTTACQAQTRRCNNGSLSGSYRYRSCTRRTGKWVKTGESKIRGMILGSGPAPCALFHRKNPCPAGVKKGRSCTQNGKACLDVISCNASGGTRDHLQCRF